jgi:hypothetical protein
MVMNAIRAASRLRIKAGPPEPSRFRESPFDFGPQYAELLRHVLSVRIAHGIRNNTPCVMGTFDRDQRDLCGAVPVVLDRMIVMRLTPLGIVAALSARWSFASIR